MGAKLSNSDVAHALGLSHSTVSRMRTGERVASVEVLQKIADEYQADPGVLLAAAAKASAGDVADWVHVLHELWDDDSEAA